MSLWTDRTVKELMARVSELERRMDGPSGPVFTPTAEDPMGCTASDLAARYTEKFGKKPHHFMKPESIREALK